MPTMSMVCHTCAQVFLSDDPVDADGTRLTVAEGHIFECPYCGVRDPYFSADYRGTSPLMACPRSSGSAEGAPRGPAGVPRGR
jgi:DNA-directed RNA polymerase subunit RPC12/RpoP